ncbi:ParB/RepB/Spo0J family partition protein [Brevirhabdus sp.]|uniref:ParB/RepB/Spo0J family partition protein n=1 Tax=Brevirhabdus sp. TaxID=2004514 RepID=UPI00405A0D28
MAKRKRLTPAQYPAPHPAGFPAQAPEGSSGDSAGPTPGQPPLETKAWGLGPQGGFAPALAPSGTTAPIAKVAGESSAAAALAEVTQKLGEMRSSGRMIEPLPLEAIQQDYLTRDRLSADEEELGALMESLRKRGQQTPIEVVALDDGAFGLISGWRRLTALKRLHQETGEPRFAEALAVRRSPEAVSDAYVAMVEENEIRVGLSYFERARIVDRAVTLGVFPADKPALQTLFASASRAKRSKIGSFLPLVRKLGTALNHPAQLSERLGLQLAKALEEEPQFARRLADRLRKAGPQDAQAEQKLLQRALAGEKEGAQTGPLPSPSSAPSSTPASDPVPEPPAESPAAASRSQGIPMPPVAPSPRHQVVPGIYLFQGREGLELRGEGVTQALHDDLANWLRNRG